MKKVGFTALAVLALAGCGQAADTSDKAAATEAPAATGSEVAKAPVTAATAESAADDRIDLTPYIGKYPSEAVNGHRFLDNPAVKAAIKVAVPDAKQRAAIEPGELEVPIVKVKGGRLLVWGGAKRAEDRYNWAVVIAPDGSKPEVCIYDGLGYDEDFQSSQWFEPKRPSIMKQGKCPSDSESYPAADIAAG